MALELEDINIGSGPDMENGDPLRIMAIKINENMEKIAQAIDSGAASTKIPDSTNLNTMTVPGLYSQDSNAGAASGINYPAAAAAGVLQVFTDSTGSALTYQVYITSSISGVSRYFWRVMSGSPATWMAWAEVATATDLSAAVTGLTALINAVKATADAAIPASQKGVAGGIAPLGTDVRLPLANAPILIAETLPTAAHDLNSYQTPGSYRQASTAGAQAGANYPQATGGILSVEGTGVSGQTVQRYTVASTGAVSPTAGARQYWRFAINTSWSPWQEVHTAGNSLPYLGRVEAGADLNNYANRGMWAIAASSVASGGTNFPIANSGWLLVYCEAAAGAAAGTNVNQIYIGSNGNRQFFRSLVGGAWSSWEEVVRSSLLGAANGIGTLDANGRQPVGQAPYSAILPAGTDANTLNTPGVWHVNSDAQATAALNWPQQLAGTLNVEAVVAGNMQVTQTYTTRNGTGGVFRTYKRIRFGASGGTWGSWQELARLADVTLDHGQCRFQYASATACLLVPYNGNGLIINGKQYRIPAAGVTFPNTGLAANAVYYVFAKDDGAGGIALDAIGTGTTTRSTHTDGVEIRTGDPTRTLVGMIVTTASGQFVNNATTRGVASWFNRRTTALFEVGTNSVTAATSYVKLTNGVSTLMWLLDAATVDCSGIVVPNGAAGGAYLINTVNGTSIGGGHGYSTGASGNQQATGVTTSYTANGDAYYNFAPYGLTSNGAISMTFKQDFRVTVPL